MAARISVMGLYWANGEPVNSSGQPIDDHGNVINVAVSKRVAPPLPDTVKGFRQWAEDAGKQGLVSLQGAELATILHALCDVAEAVTGTDKAEPAPARATPFPEVGGLSPGGVTVPLGADVAAPAPLVPRFDPMTGARLF